MLVAETLLAVSPMPVAIPVVVILPVLAPVVVVMITSLNGLRRQE
jgi:hypothetical protein